MLLSVPELSVLLAGVIYFLLCCGSSSCAGSKFGKPNGAHAQALDRHALSVALLTVIFAGTVGAILAGNYI